ATVVAPSVACRRRVVRVIRLDRRDHVDPKTPGQRVMIVPADSTNTKTPVAPCNKRPLTFDAATLKQLLWSKVGLPQPFFQASVRLGQSAKYLDRRLPDDAFIAWEPPFYPGTCIGLDTLLIDGTTYVPSAFVRLPRADARSLVVAVWGEPTATRTASGA